MKRGFFLNFVSLLPLAAAFLSCSNDSLETDQVPETKLSVSVGSVSQIEDISLSLPSSLNLILKTNDIKSLSVLVDSLVEILEERNIRLNGPDELHEGKGIGGIRTAPFVYKSVDGKGEGIFLSGRLYWPYNKQTGDNIKASNVVLYCHETMYDESATPSLVETNEFGNLAVEGNLVVIPDYIGFGVSGSVCQTYLCHNLIARNCLDAVLAAIRMADGEKVSELAAGYGSYAIGYSQGGGNAMAFQRYVETEATSQQRDTVNFKRSFVGSGPYSPSVTYNSWYTDKEMTMPVLLAMVIQGFKAGGKDGFENCNVKNFFSMKFKQAVDLGKLEKKQLGMLALNMSLRVAFSSDMHMTSKSTMPYFPLDVIFCDSVLNKDSYSMKLLESAMEEENLLAEGWTPQHPISLFYSSGDDVVPPANSVAAFEKFKETGLVRQYDCKIKSHLLSAIPYAVFTLGLEGYKSDDGLSELPGWAEKMIKLLSEAADVN